MSGLKTTQENFRHLYGDKPEKDLTEFVGAIAVTVDQVISRLNEMDEEKVLSLPNKIETLYDVERVAEYYGCMEHELTVNGTEWNFKFSDPSGPYKDKIREFVENHSPPGSKINVGFGLVE